MIRLLLTGKLDLLASEKSGKKQYKASILGETIKCNLAYAADLSYNLKGIERKKSKEYGN